jgi:predicted permease
MLETIFQDLHYAVRTLKKSPGFAVTAILTLALGIGASTAVFTVVDSVVLKPLAYHDSGRLVVAWERVPFLGADLTGPNPQRADTWRRRSTAFSGMALLRQTSAGVSLGAGHPEYVGVVAANPNLFDVLQVAPYMGRLFRPEEGMPGKNSGIVITYGLWRRVFGGDGEVIGKTLRLSDVPREVIGVLQPSFHFPNSNALRAFQSKQNASSVPEPEIFMPEALDYSKFGWSSNFGNWLALGRLKDGVGMKAAETQLTSIEAQIEQEIPANERNDRPGQYAAVVQPMQEAVVGSSRTGLWLLMAAVLGLELIACVNLANAQLGRALARNREAAVRMALGAARGRMIWNALAENLVLAMVGGAGGVLLAWIGLEVFRRYSPVDLPRMAEVHLNTSVLGFSILLALLSSVLSGLIPAFRLMRTDPQVALQQNTGRAMGSRESHALRGWLIGAQVFGCTALLLVTGLFAKSLLNLLNQDRGFSTEHVALAEVRLPPATYERDESRVAFDDGVLRNLRGMGGVQTVGMTSAMPLQGESWIEGVTRLDKPQVRAPLVNLRWASAGYFETMGAKLVTGRFLEERDRDGNGAVFSEGEAKAVWPGENPIGAKVRIEGRVFTVVGVVADSRGTSLKSEPAKMVWVHYKDRAPYSMVFLAKGTGAAGELVGAMRQAIWKYAPGITISRAKTMDAQLTDSLATERFQTMVLVAFGMAALLLAMLGIYGVLSYSVETRRQEIGVRMALGASRESIYALTFREAAGPVLVGLGAGLLASVWAGKVIQKLLYGIRGVDAGVMGAVAGLFVAAALVAAFLPARRAASLEPMQTLRTE